MEQFVFFILYFFLILSLVASYAIGSFGLTFLFGAPYVGTSKKVAREMLTFVDLKAGETFADVGSGSGMLLVTAVKEFGAKKAIGYEINPVLVIWTRLRAIFAGVSDQVEIRRGNFFKQKLEPVDVVGLYLLDGTMDKLLTHLRDQLSPQTRIISRGFKFHQMEPLKKTEGKVSNLYLYRLNQIS